MESGNEPDGVVLLHGIFRTHRNMAKLARFLGKNGYRTLNLSYPSTRKSIKDIAQHIHPPIHDFSEQVTGRIHFVGYSLGALVIRSYLNRFRPRNLGRVVMLGSPNHGSELADVAKGWWLYRKFYGPAGMQLVTRLEGAEELFGEVNYELGVIAGSRSLDPLATYIMGGPNDGRVSIQSTRLEGMKDHVVIAANHTFFATNRKAWLHTLHFLKEGRFADVTR